MRWTVEKQLAVSLLLPLALLIINAVISFRASRTLIRKEPSVSHTLRVLNELEATLEARLALRTVLRNEKSSEYQ